MADQSEANLLPHLERFWMHSTTDIHVFFINSIHRKPFVTFPAIPHTKFHLLCKILDKFFVRYKLTTSSTVNNSEQTKWQIALKLHVSIEDSGANLASNRFLTISLSGLFEWSILVTYLTECKIISTTPLKL